VKAVYSRLRSQYCLWPFLHVIDSHLVTAILLFLHTCQKVFVQAECSHVVYPTVFKAKSVNLLQVSEK